MSGESLSTIIAIALAAILLFVFPLMTMADRVDDQTQLKVQSAVTDFVTKVKDGEFTKADYENLVQTISSTGNIYNVEITAQISDKNLGKKSLLEQQVKIGAADYYVEFSHQIWDKLEKDGVIKLKEGDIVTVNVTSESKTMANQLRSGILQDAGNEAPAIVAQDTVMVTANGK